MILANEALLACFALVRLLTGVNSNVTKQLGRTNKPLQANVALMFCFWIILIFNRPATSGYIVLNRSGGTAALSVRNQII